MRARLGVCAVFLLASGVLIGCGGGSSSTTPPVTSITGSISGAPQSLVASGNASITATVTGDGTNAGVDWSCAPTGGCGSFNPAHTASGTATTYTAPAAAGSVTITATATASGKAIATATFTITLPTVALSLAAAPATLSVNGNTPLTATVTNDSTNAGVDWTCSPTGSCGTFNPAHTVSGTATSYTAPGAAGTVTVTATATASAAATESATITITSANSVANLKGSFAFALLGRDAGTHPYSLAGSVALDGNGNVTGGEQDYNNAEGTASPTTGDTITGGTYAVGADGRGTLVLITNNTKLGTNGTENFSLTVVNNNHALLVQDDASGTAGGTLDFQTIAGGLTQVNGTYSFAVTGATDNNPEVFGGTITSTGTGTLSVIVDSNSNGTVHTHGTNTGGYAAPDAMGRGTMTFGGDNFVYYVVGPEALRLIVVGAGETDLGSAYGQGTGSFSAASLKGNYIFKNGSAESGAGSYASAGLLTTDGNGNITSGFADVDQAGTVSSGAFTGTYTLASNGYGSATITGGNTQGVGTFGVYAIDPNLNPLDPNSTTGGGVALILDLDAKSTNVGGGVLLAEAAQPLTFQGSYAVGYRGFTPAGVEQNLVGQITVNSAATTSGNADAADLVVGSPHLGVTISGTLTPDTAHADRFTLSLTIAIGANPPTLNFVVYQVSTGDLIWVETDTTQYVSGSIEQQQQ